jgi:acetyltransferase
VAAARDRVFHNRYSGNRLDVITNAGGPGVMAIDRAVDLGMSIASLSAEIVERLNQVLPATWSHNNLVDIIGDATPQRYRDAVGFCMEDVGLLVPLGIRARLPVRSRGSTEN